MLFLEVPNCVSDNFSCYVHSLQQSLSGHDLMFDNGLQFRPTYSRRKRQLSEAYWTAVIREVESGCTCFSVDKSGAPMMTPACVCNQIPIPPLHPIIGYCPALQVMTVRSPSRIRPLLSEFLEVLLLVIQPLQSVSGMYVNPDSFKAQMEEHSTQANYIRSIIDPALIEQELRHNLFDLSSLLRAIGVLLKGHCAPMRDSAVEDMVRAAETCKPGGPGTKAEGVNALRTCLEILELMKLVNESLQKHFVLHKLMLMLSFVAIFIRISPTTNSKAYALASPEPRPYTSFKISKQNL